MRISDWSSDVCSSDLEISILAFAALLAAAAVEDVRRLIIPNRIPLGIIILYPAYVLSTGAPVDWVGGSTLAAGALAIGIVLFAFRYAGGGDVKLFVAASLWAGDRKSTRLNSSH